LTEKIDSAGNKKNKKNLWYQLVYLITFLIFLLELVYFTKPKFEIVDGLAVLNLIVLTYFLSKIKKKEPWIMPHRNVITTLWLMIFLTCVFRSIIWN